MNQKQLKSKIMKKRNINKSSWVVGATTMIGLLAGFFFLHISVQILLASIIIGVGTGLILTPVLYIENQNNKKQ